MTMEEAALFDPFGIASELFQEKVDHGEQDDALHQQKQQQAGGSSSPSSIIVKDPSADTPIGSTSSNKKSTSQLLKTTKKALVFHSSSPPARGPPEVSRVTRSSTYRSTLTNVSSSATTTTAANLRRGPASSRGGGGGGGVVAAVPTTPVVAVRPSSTTSRASSAHAGAAVRRTIPPKLQVRMTKYEEVASQAFSDDVGAATVSVEGSLYVQVQGSDALKNAPFALRPSSPYNNCISDRDTNTSQNSRLSIKPNTRYTTQAPVDNNTSPSVEQKLIVHGKLFFFGLRRARILFQAKISPAAHDCFCLVLYHACITTQSPRRKLDSCPSFTTRSSKPCRTCRCCSNAK
jgi:hypothetical protein